MGINVGDKYIIEIGAVAELPDGKKKYFIKPFESLVFDRKGLEQLKKFDNVADTLYQTGFKEGYKKAQARPDLKRLKDDSYNKGYEDGAKNQDEVQYNKGYNKALEDVSELMAYITQDFIDNCYPNDKGYNLYDLNAKYGLARILKDYKAYEEKKKAEGIKIGDEVIYLPNNTKFYVIGESPNRYKGIYYAEHNKYLPLTICDFEKDKCMKTGKHFEEISKLLDKLRNEIGERE